MLKNPREKTIILAGALIIVLVLGHEYIYAPLMGKYAQMGEDILSSQLRLDKSSAKIEQKPAFEARIKLLNDKLGNFDKLLLTGQKPSLAAASLQKIIKTVVTQNKAALTSEKIMQPAEIGKYTRIPVQVSIRCLVSDLKNVLYQIENHKTLLDITQISIRVATPRDPSEVEASMVVEGIILTSEDNDHA